MTLRRATKIYGRSESWGEIERVFLCGLCDSMVISLKPFSPCLVILASLDGPCSSEWYLVNHRKLVCIEKWDWGFRLNEGLTGLFDLEVCWACVASAGDYVIFFFGVLTSSGCHSAGSGRARVWAGSQGSSPYALKAKVDLPLKLETKKLSPERGNRILKLFATKLRINLQYYS